MRRRLFSTSSAAAARFGRLDGKTCFVTGAGGGLGEAIAKTFAAAGGNVVVADMRADAARSVAAALPTSEGNRHVGMSVNVTSEKQVDDAVAETLRDFGSLDVMVCNAGVQHICAVDELKYEDWSRVLAVHMDGTFLCTRAALRHMYERGQGGKVVIMGSVHSKEASLLKAPYVSAKHGLMGFAKTVAKEAGPHDVAVNVVCPGFVYTPLVEKQIPQQAERLGISEEEVVKRVMLGQTVDGKFTELEDIADLTLFFASFPNSALTGQSLTASHGWNMA